jgi:hypothetical protein
MTSLAEISFILAAFNAKEGEMEKNSINIKDVK